MATTIRSKVLAGLTVLMGCAGVSAAQQINVNVQASQQPFNRGVFGLNADASPYYSEGYGAAYDASLSLLNGTSYRGEAGGFWAESYDWRIREKVSGPLPLPGGGMARGQSTLELLRNSRDSGGTNLILTVNEHGLGHFDNGNVVYDDTSLNTLTTMAADWVFYTNYIVQNYRQGDDWSQDPKAADITRVLNSLNWTGPDFRSDLLLAPGEAAVPKATYWEIGNEVNLRAGDSPADTGAAYRSRYNAITTAMTAIDNTIKVGPSVTGMYQNGQNEAKDYLKELLKPVNNTWERVDFVSYHPYDNSANLANDNHAAVVQALKDTWWGQDDMRNWAKTQINQNFGNFLFPKYYPTRARLSCWPRNGTPRPIPTPLHCGSGMPWASSRPQ